MTNANTNANTNARANARAKASHGGGKKRPMSAYNKFVRQCSQTDEAKTRSGKDMISYCAKQWRAMSDAEKQKWK